MAKQKGRRGSSQNVKSKTDESGPKDPRLTLQLRAAQRAHIEAAAAKERLSAQNFARQASLKRADDVLGRTVTEPGPEWADK